MRTTIEDFIGGKFRYASNEWFKDRALKVYLRRSKRIFAVPDPRYKEPQIQCPITIDIGALDLHPRFVNKLTGAMQILQMVLRIEAAAAKKKAAVYVENCYTEALQLFFKRRGYIEFRNAGFPHSPPSYAKMPKKN